ncbi:MAG: MBOAT family protein [Mariniblastus sp.]
MFFNSLDFLIFGAIFFGLWPLLRKDPNCRWAFLVVASFIFYGWWDFRFLLLIVASGLIDFFAALMIDKSRSNAKLFLILSLCTNIGLLATFKYLDFFTANINTILTLAGDTRTLPLAELILPVGISFYTFQSMSYTIDVYRNELKPTRNLLHFFAYLSMFPQLVAGPIVRASVLLPQLEKAEPISTTDQWKAMKLIVRGYFKKMVVADAVAPIVDSAFTSSEMSTPGLFWWAVMILFALQIYCDFSGYSDIAIGLGAWMGYQFPLNFNHPYSSIGFREFWSRWHISLSTWFRDYVYIPLGGSRKGKFLAHVFMWITMVTSGFWHGAAWTFIVWGTFHAAMLSIERFSNWPSALSRGPVRAVGVVITFALVLVSWVFFRAENMPQAMLILQSMFNFSEGISIQNLPSIDKGLALIVGVMLIWHLFACRVVESLAWVTDKTLRPFQPVFYATLIVLCIFLRGTGQAFVYFQF